MVSYWEMINRSIPNLPPTNSKVYIAVAGAGILWFAMFSPWTSPFVPFWPAMSCSAAALSISAFLTDISLRERLRKIAPRDALAGAALAAAFWALFWGCERIASSWFDFARPQIDSIYSLADGSSRWTVAAILLLLIGPAEEIFWRAFVQHNLSVACGRWRGFLITTLCYSLVHIWSFNLMLILAAAVIGSAWGLLYLFFPKRIGAIVISHALWDVAAFVLFPL